MKIPSPLNGWRVFAGEVGVIVLGVLLALGAQQAVDNWQMRAEVREFRRAIDHEIGLNLFVYAIRSRGSACNDKRIGDLAKWVQRTGDRTVLPKIRPGGPPYMIGYRTVWDSRNAAVFAHVPVEARRKYAEFYDELAGNMMRLEGEERAWAMLVRYAIPGPISIDDRRMILGTLADASRQSSALDANLPISRKIAETLGIKPIQPDNVGAEFLKEVEQCEPMFVEPAMATSAGG